MTIDPTDAGAANIIERVKNILSTPQAEWDRIATEEADVPKLYMGYALLLALAACAAYLLARIIGGGAIMYALVNAAVTFVFIMGGIFVMAIVTNALAPNFGSVKDQGQAHKLSVYGATAGLVGALAVIVPFLGGLIALAGGIYSLVLIYIGLPRLMRTPEDKRVGYFATIVFICIIIGAVFGMVLGPVMALASGLQRPSYTFGEERQDTTPHGEVTLPGGGTVNLGALQRQAEAMQANGGSMPAVDPMRLQEQLPQSLPGGFALASTSNSSALGISQAEGVYQNGDARITVTIVQLGDVGALATMAGAMNVQENRQDASGYASVQTIDGRVYSEEVSNTGGATRYGVVGRGVALRAEGSSGVTLDQARAAVETIGVARLEREFGST